MDGRVWIGRTLDYFSRSGNVTGNLIVCTQSVLVRVLNRTWFSQERRNGSISALRLRPFVRRLRPFVRTCVLHCVYAFYLVCVLDSW